MLSSIRCLAASLASSHYKPAASASPGCDKPETPADPAVSKGQSCPQLSHCFMGRTQCVSRRGQSRERDSSFQLT